MAFPTVEELTDRLHVVLRPHGWDLEGVVVTRAGKKSLVRVAVDADQQPDLDHLEAVSQEISTLFDAAEAAGELNFGAGYTLEVTSRGVDAPLNAPRHWRRARHRLVRVTGTDIAGQQVDGVWRIGDVSAAADRVVLVSTTGKTPQVRVLDLDSPYKAVVQIEFAQPPEAQLELTRTDFDNAIAWQEDDK
ncbi:ribosome maturation factor RimP [Corynebacterium uberis]|uniref:ribosome maturation factor RimP n=1 Tax=Corynebacterium TaxID=1716 RepID=UPI001D0BB5E7|nr:MULTISPECIES: ribosome maturation factor RimP [Corynebacterium]MCZ9308447.1 ribosome maturation factor RimP [Corynebacterium sp. c6VSa_13]UDL74112.1 ribosome maturation factor RimP [Corynebacterium uberis]UDL75004.1 ribosome maturation factor RimP [Corynebacterium uberis]UDL77219.1 ribosome maturation factor RimP [Corynebacterium uberis]UDL79501.1 ribosome maturation factor RimP [Corynebacterium uberis]